MDDDLLKDLANQILSGSLDVSVTEASTKDDEENKFTVQSILESLIDSDWIDEQLTRNITPHYCLLDIKNNSSHYWVLNAIDKTMSKIPAQTELIPLEETKNNKTYCMIGDSMFLISNSLICYVGWN